MNQSKKIIVRTRAIIIHDGKLLIVRHAHDTSFAALPGGHLEWGEGIIECLQREIVEELGVTPTLGRLLYINNFIQEEVTQSIEFFFEVLNSADYLHLEHLDRTHAHELADICWVTPTDDVHLLPERISKDFKEGVILSDTVRYI